MFGQVIVIDSSDDEEAPKKKMKLEAVTNEIHGSTLDNLRISNVTSLSGKQFDDDIVIIEDDDFTKHENNSLSSKEQVLNNCQENGVANSECEINELRLCHDTENIILPEPNIEDTSSELVITSITSYASNGVSDHAEKEKFPNLKSDVLENNHTNENTADNNDSLTKKSETENVASVSSTSTEMSEEFRHFLEICSSCNLKQKYADIIQKRMQSIKEKYFRTEPEFLQSKSFLKLLKIKTDLIKEKPAAAVICFNDIYQELKARKKREEYHELTDREKCHLRKLGKTLRLLYKKIKELELKPVDWDDDNDSAYIQLDRYKKRFNDVYIKICSYTGENRYAGRSLYRKLDFDASQYPEINRAVDNWYTKTKSFPTYNDVEKCIRKCVKEKNLDLSEFALGVETKKVFTALGNLIQRRRKFELQDMLSDYIGSSIDPALEDTNLKNILDEQYKKSVQKIEAIFEEFNERQERGEDPAVSSDSDDSNKSVSSDTD